MTRVADEAVDRWFRLLADEGRGLTAWEMEFLESVQAQWDRTRRLSPKQLEILERIYAEKTP